jgi:hypothetical protein
VNAPSPPLSVSDVPLRDHHAATSTTRGLQPYDHHRSPPNTLLPHCEPLSSPHREPPPTISTRRRSTRASAASTVCARSFTRTATLTVSTPAPERGDYRPPPPLVEGHYGPHQEEDSVTGHRGRHQVCLRRLFVRYHVYGKF